MEYSYLTKFGTNYHVCANVSTATDRVHIQNQGILKFVGHQLVASSMIFSEPPAQGNNGPIRLLMYYSSLFTKYGRQLNRKKKNRKESRVV